MEEIEWDPLCLQLHADVLTRVSNMEVLSQYHVKKFAQDLTKFVPHMVDMCP